MTAQIDSLQSYLVAALTRLIIYLRDSWPGVLTGVGVVRTLARLGPDMLGRFPKVAIKRTSKGQRVKRHKKLR